MKGAVFVDCTFCFDMCLCERYAAKYINLVHAVYELSMCNLYILLSSLDCLNV